MTSFGRGDDKPTPKAAEQLSDNLSERKRGGLQLLQPHKFSEGVPVSSITPTYRRDQLHSLQPEKLSDSQRLRPKPSNIYGQPGRYDEPEGPKAAGVRAAGSAYDVVNLLSEEEEEKSTSQSHVFAYSQASQPTKSTHHDTAVPPPAALGAVEASMLSEKEKKSISLSPDRKSFPEKLRTQATGSKRKFSTNASNLEETAGHSVKQKPAKQSMLHTYNLSSALKNLSNFSKQDKLNLTSAIKNSNALKRLNLDNRVQSSKIALRGRSGAPAAEEAAAMPAQQPAAKRTSGSSQ